MGLFRTIYLEIRDILGFKPPEETPEQRAETLCKKVKERRGGKVGQGDEAWVLTTTVGERSVTVEVSIYGAAAAFETTCRIKRSDYHWSVAHESALEDDAEMVREAVSAGLIVEGFDREMVNDQRDGWTRLPLAARSSLTKLLSETRGTVFYEGGKLQLLPEAETLEGLSGASTLEKQLDLFAAVADGIDEGWGR